VQCNGPSTVGKDANAGPSKVSIHLCGCVVCDRVVPKVLVLCEFVMLLELWCVVLIQQLLNFQCVCVCLHPAMGWCFSSPAHAGQA
jgi:hypothetical protein